LTSAWRQRQENSETSMFGKAEIEKRKLIKSPRHPGCYRVSRLCAFALNLIPKLKPLKQPWHVRFRLDRRFNFHQNFPTTIRKMKIKIVIIIN
jgi:hypothetical protein